MICTVAATHPESYSTTGRGSYKPFTSATCVCLPTRPSSVPKLPLFSAGSGMLAPFLPVPTVLTPSPRTPSRTLSFIGAYKVLSCVIPRCSSYLAPLDAVTAGRPSQESINWTDDLSAAFRSAQNTLSSALTITIPRPEDQLWIVTDGAVWDPGIGVTLYVTRGDKLCLWLPQHEVAGLPNNVASMRGRSPLHCGCNKALQPVSYSKLTLP